MTEKKEYRSAVRSRRLIRDAFLELLKEKPFEKITVTDIVNRADINRSTFYAHYTDVMALVEEILDEVAQRSLSLISEMDFQNIFRDPKPFVRGLMEIGMEYSESYQLLSSSDFAMKQTEKVKELFFEKAMSVKDIPQELRLGRAYEIQTHFFIGGIFQAYQQWLMGKLDYSIDEITDVICRIITGTAQVFLNTDYVHEPH